MFSSGTYELEDCLEYQAMTDNSKQSHWTIPSAVSSSSIFGYSNDGWKFGNVTSYSRMIHNTQLTFPFSVEFKLMEINSTASGDGLTHFIYSNGSTPNYGLARTSTYWWVGSTSNKYTSSVSAGDVIRVEWKQGTVDLYVNNVKILTGSHSVTTPTNVEFHTGNNRYVRIKDFKIKPL